MRKALVMIAALALAFTAMAAEDVAGTWKATLNTPNGSMENTFVLKVVDGTKITGTISSEMMGEQQISAGKIEGDKITFSVSSDFGTITYAGKVKGDDMTLTLTAGEGQFTLEVAAKRKK